MANEMRVGTSEEIISRRREHLVTSNAAASSPKQTEMGPLVPQEEVLKTVENCVNGEVETKSALSGFKKYGRRASRQNTHQ